jgi:hypothetical protein
LGFKMKGCYMNKKLFVIFAILGVFGACQKREVVTKETVTNNPFGSSGTGSTGTGGGSTGVGGSTLNASCYAEGTGPQANDYYTLPNIVAHGSGSNIVQWSSATDPRLQNPYDQNIFLTDGRFNVRVIALPSPGQGVDSYGNSCQYMALPYTKLKVKVGIRVPGSSTYVSTYTFDNIAVNNCSNVREFSLPSINNPFIVEVLETKWDYSCIAYTQEGFPDASACPWDYVWKNDCFEVQVQIATSYTKDIPH